MTPYYEEPGIQIYHGDCREVLPLLPIADLLLTDPPYGVKMNPNSTRFSGGTPASIRRRGGACRQPIPNDDRPFAAAFLLEYGQHQVIWGWNHFAQTLPPGGTLIWLKRYPEAFGSFLSDAEIAWMSKGTGVYCRLDLSNNAIAMERTHPTQKPLSLMMWCISFFPTARYIYDPFMGSGTTLRAAKELGRMAIGIDIEERYCEIAVNRLRQEVLPLGAD